MKKQLLQSDESYFLRELRQKIQEKTTISFSEFYDCKRLADKLAEEGIIISAHTIARFFGILKSNHRPYTSTLNLLVNFIGFHSFNEFKINVKQQLEYALANPLGQFHTGDFSYTALELAIQTNDWKSVQSILESFQYSCGDEKNTMSMFLGNWVRQHSNKNEFLHALIEIENGRELFYESFVDEDDPGNYYSEALSKYYVKNKNQVEKTIFHACFINTKKIYSNKSIQKMDNEIVLDSNLDFSSLHFHQASRIIELRILIYGLNKNNIQKMDKLISEMLKILPNYSNYEKCWLMARTIKALAFTKSLISALKNPEFNTALFQCYQNMNGSVLSIAEMIIQLTAHKFQTELREELLPPMRIQEKHLNETNARIAIESATARLYASQPVKKIIEKNLNTFAKSHGQTWLLETFI